MHYGRSEASAFSLSIKRLPVAGFDFFLLGHHDEFPLDASGTAQSVTHDHPETARLRVIQ
jgi:hypothetical protein